MDPFSITVGALGIAEIALSSIKQLHETISGLNEAQDVLDEIKSNLKAIQRPLEALQKFKFPDGASCAKAKEDLKKTGMVEAVNECGKACDDFNKKLTYWTKNSTNTKLSLRDRLSVGVWNKEKIRTFKIRVQTCQSLVQMSIESAQLMLQFRSASASEEYHTEVKAQIQTLNDSITQHIQRMNSVHDETKQREEQLRKESAENYDEDDEASQRNSALQELEKQLGLIKSDKTSADTVASQLKPALSKEKSPSGHNISVSGNTYQSVLASVNSGNINYTYGKKDPE